MAWLAEGILMLIDIAASITFVYIANGMTDPLARAWMLLCGAVVAVVAFGELGRIL